MPSIKESSYDTVRPGILSCLRNVSGKAASCSFWRFCSTNEGFVYQFLEFSATLLGFRGSIQIVFQIITQVDLSAVTSIVHWCRFFFCFSNIIDMLPYFIYKVLFIFLHQSFLTNLIYLKFFSVSGEVVLLTFLIHPFHWC